MFVYVCACARVCACVRRVLKGGEDVRLMRPASPVSQTPDTQQEAEKGPARMEPDTTQPGTSREVTGSMVSMMRSASGASWQRGAGVQRGRGGTVQVLRAVLVSLGSLSLSLSVSLSLSPCLCVLSLSLSLSL